ARYRGLSGRVRRPRSSMSDRPEPRRPPILGSGLLESIAEGALDDDYYRDGRRKPGTGIRTRIVLGGALAVLAGLLTIGAVQTAREDRKSTRLNSSHVSISYAVFCLKKKQPKQ